MQLNSNSHSNSSTVDFTPSHRDTLVPTLINWDTEVVTSGIYSHFPKGRAFSGMDHRISCPPLKEQLLAGRQQNQLEGLQRNSYGLCLYLCFCWGLKRGETGEIFPSLIPLSKKSSSCPQFLQYPWDKQHPCGLLLICSGWWRSDLGVLILTVNRDGFIILGVMFANKKEKITRAGRIFDGYAVILKSQPASRGAHLAGCLLLAPWSSWA